METTGGDAKKMAVFVGAHGGCFLFLGCKKIGTCSLYRDDFRCLIINKNPVIFIKQPRGRSCFGALKSSH